VKYLKLFESFSKKLYHGNRKGDFPPKKKRFAGAIFLTTNLDFAKDFAGLDEKETFPDGGVWEVELKSGLKICNLMDRNNIIDLDLNQVIENMIKDKYIDPVNGTRFNEISGKGFKGYDPKTDKEFDLTDSSESVYFYLWRIKNGAWRIIETEPVINRIKEKGYDGFVVTEKGSENIAIFDEGSMKEFKKIY